MADFHFITPRLALGGGVWTRQNLEAISRAGITHIVNTQAEFDDRTLLSNYGRAEPEVLWLATEDDFQPKPFDYFCRGVSYALQVLDAPDARLLVHCASGIHRGPMVVLAVLRVLGYRRAEAEQMIRARRPQADFPDVYLDSVEAFVAEWESLHE